MNTYCLKCKKKTEDLEPYEATSKNGKRLQKSKCACGCPKCRILGKASLKKE